MPKEKHHTRDLSPAFVLGSPLAELALPCRIHPLLPPRTT